MKKIIAITSFLFLLMVAVLPQQAAQAASTYTATVTINGVDYEIDSYENTIYMNIDDLVEQFGLNETDKVEKVSIKTPAGAQSIGLAPGYVSALFSEAQFPVVNNEAGIVLSAVLGAADSQQDGVSIKTFREFLFPVNNSVIGQFKVNYSGSSEDLVLVLDASKELELPGTTPVNVSGLSLTTSAGEVKAKNIVGNHYYLNVAGIPAGSDFQSIKVNSDTATTVSVFSRTSGFYSDATDVQFVNKEALLDKPKIANWAAKYGVPIPSLQYLPIDLVAGVLYETGITTLNGIVADQAGNESSFSVTFETGWVFADGNWYYLDENGNKATGWVSIDGDWYYFFADGAMSTNHWQQDSSKKWFYLGEDGVMLTNSWVLTGDKWYYVGKDGAMLTSDWVLYNNKWYYLKSNGVMAENEWVLDKNGKWYYLGKDGVMLTNTWVKDGNKMSFVGPDGAWVPTVTLTNTWIKDGDKWYYVGKNGVNVKNDWLLYKNEWYYFNAAGVMVTNDWVLYKNKWYYFNKDGVMATGWVFTGGKWYFMNNGGVMQTGWVLTGGKWYYLYSNGSMAANTYIGKDYVGSNGAWIPGR